VVVISKTAKEKGSWRSTINGWNASVLFLLRIEFCWALPFSFGCRSRA
jgi:hypothetical protein